MTNKVLMEDTSANTLASDSVVLSTTQEDAVSKCSVAPLTEEEKAQLKEHHCDAELRNQIVDRIIGVRGGEYPPDWCVQVIEGALFGSRDDPKLKIGRVLSSVSPGPSSALSCEDLKRLVKARKAVQWNMAEYKSPPPYPEPYTLYVMCERMGKIVKVASREEGIELLMGFLQPRLYCVKQ